MDNKLRLEVQAPLWLAIVITGAFLAHVSANLYNVWLQVRDRRRRRSW